jgi:hypothetical protein
MEIQTLHSRMEDQLKRTRQCRKTVLNRYLLGAIVPVGELKVVRRNKPRYGKAQFYQRQLFAEAAMSTCSECY